MDTAFLDWALADFSGYVAADEVYDGPFCILSVVDNRRYKRILYDLKVARKWRGSPYEPPGTWLSWHQASARACRSSSL